MVLDEETSNISQGQKQLLTIARAILSNPRILSSTRHQLGGYAYRGADPKALVVLMRNRTSFIIAHRLSTIRNATYPGDE